MRPTGKVAATLCTLPTPFFEKPQTTIQQSSRQGTRHKAMASPTASTTSIVDRTIHATFPQLPIDTPSSSSLPCTSTNPSTIDTNSNTNDNTYPHNIELLHRINGTSILSQCTTLLRLSPDTYATSTTIFHRFYHRQSLLQYDVWGVCMACVLLACKIGNGDGGSVGDTGRVRVSDIILVFVHVYRRMRLGIDCDDDDDDTSKCNGNGDHGDTANGDRKSKAALTFRTAYCSLLQEQKRQKKTVLTQEERKNILRYVRPLPRNGIIYREWEEELMKMENVLLRELGFTLYWIPESHPHVFLLYFMKVLDIVDKEDGKNSNNGAANDEDGTGTGTGINGNGDHCKAQVVKKDSKGIAQIAWNYCNDSCRLDLCVRYEPELIACGAIYLASLHGKEILPMEPRPWWYVFIGLGHDQDLSNVCNALLALRDEHCIPGYTDAMKKYVISLVEGGSFNDPGSYSWNAID